MKKMAAIDPLSSGRRELIITDKNLKQITERNPPNVDILTINANLLEDFDVTNIKDSKIIRLNMRKNVLKKPMTQLPRITTLINLSVPGIGRIAFNGIDFSPMRALKIADVSENDLEELPTGMDNLSELNISFNRLSSINSLKNMRGVVRLNLSNNNLEECEFDPFSEFPQILEMDLSGNPLPGAGLFFMNRTLN